jgi:hypothetical protein
MESYWFRQVILMGLMAEAPSSSIRFDFSVLRRGAARSVPAPDGFFSVIP